MEEKCGHYTDVIIIGKIYNMNFRERRKTGWGLINLSYCGDLKYTQKGL